MKKTEQNLFIVLGIGWVLAAAALLIFKPPFWALMDDAANLSYIDLIRQNGTGLWQFVIEYSRRDVLSWGMFRPIYPALVYIFYGFFYTNPAAAYLTNAALMGVLFYFWGLFFERFSWRMGGQPAPRWLFLAMCFIFTPHYNLVFFTSLQEKLVLWGGLLVSWMLYGIQTQTINRWVGALGIIIGSLFALFSKATALFLFGPVVCWLFLLCINERRNIPLIIVVAAIYLSAAYYFSSIRTGYSNSYSLADLPSRMVHAGPRFMFPFIAGVLSLFLIMLHTWSTRTAGGLKWSFRFSIWPLGLLSYLMIMLPWKAGIGYYLITPAGVFIIGTILSVYQIISPRLPFSNILLALAIAFASVFAFKKFRLWANEHHGTGLVTTYIKNNILSDASVVMAMPEPCHEGHLSLNYLLGQTTAIQLAQGNIYPNVPTGTRKFLIVDKYCPETSPNGFSPDRVLFEARPWAIYEDLPNP